MTTDTTYRIAYETGFSNGFEEARNQYVRELTNLRETMRKLSYSFDSRNKMEKEIGELINNLSV